MLRHIIKFINRYKLIIFQIKKKNKYIGIVIFLPLDISNIFPVKNHLHKLILT